MCILLVIVYPGNFSLSFWRAGGAETADICDTTKTFIIVFIYSSYKSEPARGEEMQFMRTFQIQQIKYSARANPIFPPPTLNQTRKHLSPAGLTANEHSKTSECATFKASNLYTTSNHHIMTLPFQQPCKYKCIYKEMQPEIHKTFQRKLIFLGLFGKHSI